MSETCSACPLSDESDVKSICLPAKGNPESKLFIIMDRPNKTEDERASPFSGGASRLFFELIQKAGIPFPSDCYVTYATKCYFPETAVKDLKASSAAACKETWLTKEITKHKPSVVVTVGAEALGCLTEVTGVMKHRGTFIDAELEGHKFKVMPTFSPSYLMNNHRELEGQVMLDLKRAYNAVHNGVSCWTPGKEKTLDYHHVKTIQDFMDMVEEIKKAGKATCDIECRGKDAYFLTFPTPGFPLVSIQFSTKPGSGWFLPLSHVSFVTDDNIDGRAWNNVEWKYIMEKLGGILGSGKIFIIGHNFKFDSKWILKYLGIKAKVSFDTMLAHGLFGETSSSLKKLAWEMTDIGGYEEEQSKYTDSLEANQKWDMFYYPMEQLSIYGCCDVDATFRVFEILDTKLMGNPQMLALFKTLVKASRAFLDIEHEGIKIDTAYLKQLDIDLTLELSKLSADFHQAAYIQIQAFKEQLVKEATSEKTGKLYKNKQIEFNIDSSDHVSKLFYKMLGFPINDRYRSKKTNDPSVGKKALEELAGKHPIAKILMEYRGLSKQKVGFVDAYPRYTDSNDRIHPDYKLIKFYNEDADKEQGTATGRLACSDPNLQQVPSRDEDKRIKRLFIPDCPDHYLMDCDYSGIELRVTAMYCVPLDSEILTKRGWLKHNEVTTDDFTLGLTNNKELEWTPVTNVIFKESEPILELKRKHFSVKQTFDHRIPVFTSNSKEIEFVSAKNLKNKHKILLSAKANTINKLPISLDEIKLIAWLLTDGYLKYKGTKLVRAIIIQSKYVNTINSLLENIGMDVTPNFGSGNCFYWSIPIKEVRDIFDRAELKKGLEQFILSLSTEERRVWLATAHLAEGSFDKKWNHRTIAQCSGDVAEAMKLAIFLEGNFPTIGCKDKLPSGKICERIEFSKPFTTVAELDKNILPPEKVWCVNTGLGSWVMRQNNQILITGNCQDPIMKKFFNEGKGDFHRHVASKVYGKPEDEITKLERTYAKATTFGILYGAGPAKIAEQAKCSIKDAQAFIEEYFKLFPTLKKWILQQKAYAQKNLSVKSLFGRVRSLPDAGSYNEGMREQALRRAVNTPIQSDASDITLYGLTRIATYLNKFSNTDPAHPSRLRASVHDSILISVHKDDFEEIAGHVKFDILEKIDLDFLTKLGVKLQAEVSIGPTWGQQIELKTED